MAGLKFYDTSEQKHSLIKALLYGPPGVGKTRTSVIDVRGAMLPGKTLFLNAESGMMSLRDVKGVTVLDLKIDPNDPEDVSVDQKTGQVIIKRDGTDKLRLAYSLLQSGKHDFSNVVADSLTEFHKMFLNRAVRDAGRGEKGIPEQRDWGVALEKLRGAIRLFRDLPVNFIAIALEQDTGDPVMGTAMKKPSISGKGADEIAAFMDLVIHMEKMAVQVPSKVEGGEPTTEIKRVFRLDGDPGIITKDRSGVLPAVCPASFAWIYEQIYGAQAGDPRINGL